jgi:hypothetical protein
VFRWLLCSFVDELVMWKYFAYCNILLIINGLFSVTSNHVQDVYTFLGDQLHQFGDLCSSYRRMISVSDNGNREGTWNSGHVFWIVAGGNWVVTVKASHLSHALSVRNTAVMWEKGAIKNSIICACSTAEFHRTLWKRPHANLPLLQVLTCL